MLLPRYDDALPQEYEYSQPHTSTDDARPLAPQFLDICIHYLLVHRHRVWLYNKNLLYIGFIMIYNGITIDNVL